MSAVELLPLLATVAVAALLCVLTIWVFKPLLQRYALARPNARSSHRVPTPQGGGIAVIAATLFAAGVGAGLMNLTIPAVLFWATLFIALTGFADDIKSIPVLPRLLLQAIAVGAILYAAPADLRIVPASPLAVERGLLLVAGLWFVNLVNFMDGLDLMTVSEVVPITAAMIALGWVGEFPIPATIVAAALCGAMAGFAPFNRPIAKVFLGDVGSLPIGLLLGWCLLQLAWHQQLAAALLLPLYYLVDATLTLLRRVISREKFWIAHRTHFYQRAADNGFSVPQIIGEVFALNVGLSALAIASTQTRSSTINAALVLVGACTVAWVIGRFSWQRHS
jgi:UDP-N-acetylmuramyl pentapeptide phosphotransferase/UDP-N-acetylglucosamine-1-phosphate transferase